MKNLTLHSWIHARRIAFFKQSDYQNNILDRISNQKEF